nr:zinc-binding dehydrogenase [Streptomyces sp. ISL-63]
MQRLKRRGASVIGTAGGGHKPTLVKELGADHAVDHALPDWADRVRDVAGGRHAAAVVLDHIGGTLGREAFGLLTSGTGREVVVGFSGGEPQDAPPLELLNRNPTLTGFSARALWSRPDQARELVTNILDLAVEGRSGPSSARFSPWMRWPRRTQPWRRAPPSARLCSSPEAARHTASGTAWISSAA